MRFSRQEYWSGLPCPPPGDRPNPGTEATYPVLASGFFTTEPPEKPIHVHIIFIELLLCTSLWRSWGLGVDNTDILTFSALLEWEGIWMLNKRGRRKTRNWEKQRCSFVSIQISHSTLLPNLDPQPQPRASSCLEIRYKLLTWSSKACSVSESRSRPCITSRLLTITRLHWCLFCPSGCTRSSPDCRPLT